MNLVVNGHLLLIAKNQSSLEIASITLNNEPILETIFDDAKIILGFPDVVLETVHLKKLSGDLNIPSQFVSLNDSGQFPFFFISKIEETMSFLFFNTN